MFLMYVEEAWALRENPHKNKENTTQNWKQVQLEKNTTFQLIRGNVLKFETFDAF